MKTKIIITILALPICAILLYGAETCPKTSLHVTGNGHSMNHAGCVSYQTKQNVSVDKHANCNGGVWTPDHCDLETRILKQTTTSFEDVRCKGKVLNTVETGEISVRALTSVDCDFKDNDETE